MCKTMANDKMSLKHQVRDNRCHSAKLLILSRIYNTCLKIILLHCHTLRGHVPYIFMENYAHICAIALILNMANLFELLQKIDKNTAY